MKLSKMLPALLLMGALTSIAMADSCRKCSSCGKKICMTEKDKAKIKKTYYDVECKEICLPPARFLSIFRKKDRGCEKPPQAKRRRVVRKLVKRSYECEELRWKFQVAEKCEECQMRCDHCAEQAPVTHPAAMAREASQPVPLHLHSTPGYVPRPVPVQKMPSAHQQYPVNYLGAPQR